jgi:hypothetical protein
LPTSPLLAQNSILGQHKIDLRLKPLPAAEVLNILSTRSRSVGQVTEPSAETGRPWDVEGAEQLEGVVVSVNFVATPIEQVVAETLGCIGYTYTEHGNRIVIEKAAQVLPADRCRSVSRLPANAVSAASESKEERYSWQLPSVSALEFLKMFADESRLNIVWPYQQTDVLANITLRVGVSEMSEDEVLKNVLGCIGWEFEKKNRDVSAFKAESPHRTDCRVFTIL